MSLKFHQLLAPFVAALVMGCSAVNAAPLTAPPMAEHLVPPAKVIWDAHFSCPGQGDYDVKVESVNGASVKVIAISMPGRNQISGLNELNGALGPMTHLTGFEVSCAEKYAVLTVRGFVTGPQGGRVMVEATLVDGRLLPPHFKRN